MDSLSLESKIRELKSLSGTHSPSIDTIKNTIGDIQIKIDACFLSNPYATDLFLQYLDEDLIKKNRLRDVLEFYPPQNRDIAKNLANSLRVSSDNIFIGNGAIEIIQAIIHKYVNGRFAVCIPTFSSYYEFITPQAEVVFYKLVKEKDFKLDVYDYVRFLKDNRINSIVLINPNNPNGAYLTREELFFILDNTKELDLVILDESFIHFAYENDELLLVENESLISKYNNLVIVKSMSKDFGIAGIRAGYAIMKESMLTSLLRNGFLWNSSGLAAYFFKLYANDRFRNSYEVVRKKYIMITNELLKDLNSIPYIHTYPSKANFALIELPPNMDSFSFTMKLLLNHGIYVRDCKDKVGLDGNFIRIASRTFEENIIMVDTLKKTLNAEFS